MSARRLRRDEGGQAILEFALVVPVFLLLVVGIIQFGIAYNNYVTLTDAVRVGAREAAVSRTLPDPVAVATTRVQQSAHSLRKSDLVISVTPHNPLDGTSTWVQGGDVTVEATYPYRISLFGLVFYTGTMKSRTTERVE